MNVFERYLTLWVGLAIVVGIALGQMFPAAFSLIAGLEVAKLNLPVSVLEHFPAIAGKCSKARFDPLGLKFFDNLLIERHNFTS